MARRAVRPTDLFAVRWLSDVRLSADGRRVACVETRLDQVLDSLRSRILVLDVDSGTVLGSPSPDDAADQAPRWSADGARLLFVGGRADGSRLWVAERDGSLPRVLDGSPAGVSDPCWSADGSVVCVAVTSTVGSDDRGPLYEVTRDRYKHDGHPVMPGVRVSTLWLVPTDGGAARQLTTGMALDRRPAWSPDGRSVAFVSDRGLEGVSTSVVDIWLVDIADPDAGGSNSGLPRRLTDGSGPITAFTWSPEGTEIGYLGHGQGSAPGIGPRLRVVPVAGSEALRDIALVDDPPFALGYTPRSDDGRGTTDVTLEWTSGEAGEQIWLRWADGGRGALGRIDLDGQWAQVVGGDRSMLSFSIAPTARAVAFIASDPIDPGEVTICDLDGGGERRLTDRNGTWLATVELGTTEVVRAIGSGELPLEAWVSRPPVSVAGDERVPLVVSVHGGPHYSVGYRFSFETHRLCAAGYGYAVGNPRGSLGYGDPHGAAIVGDWGGDDLEDVLAITDAAAALPGVDPDRLAITGVSYGGYMTMWALTRDQRFRVAISENGISDLMADFGTTEGGPDFWVAEMGTTPWERPEAYVERSPIRFADRIRTPLLLLHAELDQGVPIGQSEQLYAALRLLGRPVSFVRVQGEGHLMNLVGSARFRLARMALIEEFLARHV